MAGGVSRPSATTSPNTLLQAIEQSLLDALRTPDGSEPPAALLWTDADQQWSGLIPRLQSTCPHIFTLGDYDPETRTGPAIWLRCVVDRALPEFEIPPSAVPILYLPGVARQTLRAGDDCPREFWPLVEMQFRGRVWHQRNGRDWTVEAFLVSDDGLALDVAQDVRTRDAARRSLALLAEIALDGLRGRRLDADDFDRLAVADPTRDLLRWMSTGDALLRTEGISRWKAFCSVCMATYRFDPDKRSPADVVLDLVAGDDRWDSVWQRFTEAPSLYPGIVQLLRESFIPILHAREERNPRDNDDAEASLRKELSTLGGIPHASAIAKVGALEAEHGKRRSWVWTGLGESSLAVAMEPIARLAAASAIPLGGATPSAVISTYVAAGCLCDRAALESLAAVRAPADVALVESVVRALYLPWLDASARHFQDMVQRSGTAFRGMVTGTRHDGESCIVFADGLRYDIACMLVERLSDRGFRVRLDHRVAPVPTVTSTAKPLASLSHNSFDGGEDIVDFRPRFKESPLAATAQALREDMATRGVDVLGDDVRAPAEGSKGGWVETGQLDHLGHSLGARLVHQERMELDVLEAKVSALLDAGWPSIRVVTDHGWLLMPGGLPSVALPAHLTALRWCRCATVKTTARPDVTEYAWHWNQDVRIASPPGICCFLPNTEYAHGGVSPQECIVPEILVQRVGFRASASIRSVTWRGMRCRVSVTTNDSSIRVDLRTNWKQPHSSIAASAKELSTAGEASLAVPDDAFEGESATVVVIDQGGNVLDRTSTIVGEIR